MASPQIAELLAAGIRRLSGFDNPALDVELLFRGVSGMTRAAVLARGEAVVPPETVSRFEAALARRAGHEPIQYILGVAAFWKDDFTVNPSVLIPRPETEILVEAAAKRVDRDQPSAFLDLGTGSGCIALSLLREHPRAWALATDRSRAALAVAAENAGRLGLSERIELRVSRWFDAIEAEPLFTAIVSNPPYVPRADEGGLPPEVRDFEPEHALFSEPTDDLSSYREIAAGLVPRLRPSGFVFLEVGRGQAEGVAGLLRGVGLTKIDILDDLARIPRVVIGQKG